jgi:hypothetical protein
MLRAVGQDGRLEARVTALGGEKENGHRPAWGGAATVVRRKSTVAGFTRADNLGE